MITPRQPGTGFFWQGVLILLPVIVLATAGFLSLRQDRILARHEAVDKAQLLADEFAQVLWTRLFEGSALEQFKEHTFRIDSRGRVIFPPPAPLLPAPRPLAPEQLEETQRRLWSAATTMHPANATARAAAIAATRGFLALKPPADFGAVAQFRLAHWLVEDGKLEEATALFRSVGEQFPDSASESGLPLAPLAQFKALETAARFGPNSTPPDAASFIALCSNLVRHPTFLTPDLLRRVGELRGIPSGRRASSPVLILALTNVVEPWQREWAQYESIRELAQAALEQFPVREQPGPDTLLTNLAPPSPPAPALFWFHAQDLSLNPQPSFPPYRLSNRFRDRVYSRNRNLLRSVELSGAVSSTVPERRDPELQPTRAEPRQTLTWLATRLTIPDGSFGIVCRALGRWPSTEAKPLLGSPILEELTRELPELPPWLGYSLDIGGVTVVSSNNLQIVTLGGHGAKGGSVWNKTAPGLAPEVLASAARFENGAEHLRVNLHFTSPQLFYLRQQTRSRLFGALIFLATAAALVGFFSARRAFLRQQQLSELKSNFVSSVSHELRAPIASMRLLAESLQRGKVAEPARQGEYFRFLVQECRRLSSLIENVLNFARIEQGRKQYELEPTDVSGLLRQTFQLMEPAALEKQLTLVLALPEAELARLAVPPLLDGQAVQQALINLIDNALKHSPPGQSVTVGLSLSPRETREPASAGLQPTPATPTTLQLYVEDHGPGIPSNEHERIFERFYRRGSELRRETQGVGIGLSIVKHIVEAHGGRVLVQSKVGQGSRFIIELPLAPAPTRA